MTVAVAVLIAPKTAESSQTTQFTCDAAASVIIDKFTATNYSSSTATLSVNLVPSAGAAGNDNLVIKTKSLQAGETYTFPELVGHVIGGGGFISTLAGTASAINIRTSGRVVTA